MKQDNGNVSGEASAKPGHAATPGPWYWKSHRDLNGVLQWELIAWSHRHEKILAMREDFSQFTNAGSRPNATLIAAAPELLAALEAFVADTAGLNEEEMAYLPPYQVSCHLRARAAIAKAKGD